MAIRKLAKFFSEEHTLITPKIEAWFRQPLTRADLIWLWILVLIINFRHH